MILLDELDLKEKEPKRDSLPPYSPGRGLRLPVSAARNASSTHSTSNAYLHPGSASVAASNGAQFQSSLTLNSNVSSQTLLSPPLPTPPPSASLTAPSTSQLSVSLSSTLCSVPPSSPYPPPHLRASNDIYVQRDSAAITGSFLIDPALQVPDCLLPDEPDVFVVSGKGADNRKGKQKRMNVCLVTSTGDISADIWIREGCALQSRNHARSHGSGSSASGSSISEGDRSNSSCSRPGRSSLDSSDSARYWDSDWTAPPPSMPWPEKTKELVDIDIRSESGSVNVRIHAQSHQRLRIHVSSAQGTITVGVPRTFAGYVLSNTHASRSDSASSSLSSLPRLGSPSYAHPRGLLGRDRDKDKSSIADELVGSIMQELSQALPISPRQPVQFSIQMEGVVTALSEQRRGAKGQYLVGDTPNRLFHEHIGIRYFDELRLESYTGTIGVFYSDELLVQKPDGIITKLLNRAR